MERDVKKATMTPGEVSLMLSRSPVTLERWRRLRKGPPHFYVGNRALYLVADVEGWLAAQKKRTGRDNDGTEARSGRRRNRS